MLQRLVKMLVGIAFDVAAAKKKASDGGTKITPAEKREITEDAIAKLAGLLDAELDA